MGSRLFDAINTRDYTTMQGILLVISGVLIPGASAPKLITRPMLKTMQPGSVLVDVAIDQGGVITWNGSAIDLLTLRQYLQQSLRLPVEPELQFQPNAATRYVVVDEVLAEIKRAGVTKLGFVGNEQYSQF